MILLMFLGAEAWSADRYSVANGNWSSVNTWSMVSGGTPGASVPVAGDDVHIEGGFTVTLDVNTAALASLSIASGSTFDASSAFTVTAVAIQVNGLYYNGSTGSVTATTFNVNNGGFYRHASTSTTLVTATWNTGSTCDITGWTNAGALTSSFNQAFYNFSWNCPNQTNNVVFGTNVTTVNGTFILINTGSTYNNIQPGGNPVYGNYVQSGGIIDFGENPANRAITVNQNFTISGGTFMQGRNSVVTLSVGGNYLISGGDVFQSRTSGSSVTVNGNFTMTGGNYRVTPNGTPTADGLLAIRGNFTLSGSSAQLILSGSNYTGTLSVAGNFSNSGGQIVENSTGSGVILFNGTGAQTYTGGIFGGTINFIVGEGTNLPVLQMGTGASPATLGNGSTGTFTILPGATLGITSPAGITTTGTTGNIQVSGTRTYSAGANYIYNGAASQSTGDGLTQNTPGNLTINNSSGVALSGETTVSGVLALTNGTVNTGTNTLVLSNNSTSAISGGSSASYIIGTLRRNIAGGVNTYTYPIGTSTAYVPVSLAFGAGTLSGYLNGSTTTGDHGSISSSDFDPAETVNRVLEFLGIGGSWYRKRYCDVQLGIH